MNFSDVHQRIDGFGAGDVWSPALTDAGADLFFSASTGIGLSILRVGIDTEGEDLSAYSNATKAAARGAIVWAAPWSAPGAWKDNGTTTNGGRLLPAYYDAWATRLAGFAATLQQNAGVPLYALSVQNEPDYTAYYYDSMVYSHQEMVDFVKVLGPKLAALNPRPHLMLPDVSTWSGAWNYTGAVLGDSMAAPYLDIVAVHQYVAVSPPQTAKPIWQTEMSSFENFDPGIFNGVGVARWIHDALVTGGASTWHYLWLLGLDPSDGGLIGYNGNTEMTKRFFTVGNFSKFVRPGFVMVGVSGGINNLVSVSAYKNPNSGEFAIVAINQEGSDIPLTIALNGLTADSVTPWVTSPSLDLTQQPDVAISGGSFTTTLPTYSVTSFVGTATTTPPAAGGGGVGVSGPPTVLRPIIRRSDFPVLID